MEIEKPFHIRTSPTSETLKLLESVTLGSNGARYKHLDTRERISQLYKPLFLNLERNSKTLANITLCRREVGWYLRYFAFETSFQTTKTNAKPKKGGVLKKQLNSFFEQVLNSEDEHTTDLLYAYIDPNNRRSLLMSENFGFTNKAKIATQTFSRVRPRKQPYISVIPTDKLAVVYERVAKAYGNDQMYFTEHTFNEAPFYGYYDSKGTLIAFVKVYKANWKIERLPGKRGSLLTNIIPFIPRIRKVINPKSHVFSVIEAVWVSEGCNQPEVMEELFEGVLFNEQTNSLIWWVDIKQPIYKSLSKSVNWGLLHKLNGVSMVDLVVRAKKGSNKLNDTPFYVTAFDFI